MCKNGQNTTQRRCVEIAGQIRQAPREDAANCTKAADMFAAQSFSAPVVYCMIVDEERERDEGKREGTRTCGK